MATKKAKARKKSPDGLTPHFADLLAAVRKGEAVGGDPVTRQRLGALKRRGLIRRERTDGGEKWRAA